ncbi:MAG: hypothetical protein LBR79_04395 [Oscillospiraceae bacterium]|jgi:GTPase SAR1 family protein|nr:hypothetical protein [Oscillospiraceae bacterium]
MKFKKFMALICTFAFTCSNLINGHNDVILIGNEKVGKTSVRLRMLGYELKGEYPHKPGFDCETLRKGNIDEEVTLWACSGYEQYPFLREFIDLAKIVVIVFDITNQQSIDDIGNHVEAARNEHKDRPIFLVANKADLRDMETCHDTLTAAADKYNIKHLYFVSALEPGDGIEWLKKGILCAIDELNEA